MNLLYFIFVWYIIFKVMTLSNIDQCSISQTRVNSLPSETHFGQYPKLAEHMYDVHLFKDHITSNENIII